MNEELLLTQDDFKPYRDISENVNFDRLSAWILETQKQELRAFLGPELFLLFITDWDPVNKVFVTPRFVDLWNGSDITGKYRFYGLKPVVVYFAYARFLKNQQTVVTRYGVKHLTRDESTDATPSSVRTRQGEAQSMAISLQNDVENYLNDNQSIYPEYNFKTAAKNQKNIYHNVKRRSNWGRGL